MRKQILFGALLAVIVIFAPGGLMGLFGRNRAVEVSRT